MIFTNRQNEKVTLEDGRTIWLSRAVAVVVTVWFQVDGKFYLLLGKRGPGCPDEVGKWNLPCGYLDWDENLIQACFREVWEETGVKLFDYLEKDVNIAVDDLTGNPWKVTSDVDADGSGKQNVSHQYGIVIRADELPALSAENCEPGEIADLMWAPMDQLSDLEYAFNHDERIEEYIKRSYIQNI